MSADDVAPADMAREQLVEQAERLEDLEEIVDIRADDLDDVEMDDIWIAGFPFGKMLNEAYGKSRVACRRINELEETEQGIEPDVRKKLLPIHRELFKVQDNEPDQVEGNKRRGVELFRMMLREAAESDEKTFGVTQSGNRSADKHTWEITRDAAGHIIDHTHWMPKNGRSKTIRRAMIQAQELSQREDCDCSEPEKCDHGLLNFSKSDSYVLTAPVSEFNHYLELVESWLTGGEEAPTGGDEAISPEQGGQAEPTAVTEDEIEDEFERLDEANRESADAVVSGPEESVSAKGGEPLR